MPGPLIPDPTPDWLKPENASVTDSALTKAMRMIGHLIGADNPTAQVLGLMMTDVPGGEATGGLAKAVEGLKQRVIKAYHGSPHDFERFSLEKIGTGEGAQAYGHGLYFAEKEGTAQSYKNVLGGREFDVKGRKLYSSSGGASNVIDKQSRAETIAADALDDAFNAQSSSPAQFAANRLRYAQRLYPEDASHINDAMRVIADWQESGQSHQLQGKMYEVAIKADPEDFLDWDKPLSQQSEKVKQALRDFGFEDWKNTPISQTKQSWDAGAMKGESIYRAVTEDAPVSDTGKAHAVATSMLKEKGIPGIKYLDQGSRGGRAAYRGDPAYLSAAHSFKSSGATPDATISGLKQAYKGANASDLTAAVNEAYDITPETRNYVVFDDQLIDILKKYGLVLPAAGLAGSEAQK